MQFAKLCSILTCFALTAQALPPISIYGTKFYDSNGDQFFLKGVAYQRSSYDPLLDEEQCRLDSALMQKLGVNTIRVYHVTPYGNHDGCMQVFDDAGIYLFVDLDTFSTQIEETDPKWTESQKNAFEKVLDVFSKYDNTAGFFIGNEVITESNHSEVAVYVKEATRDLKAYRDSKGFRQIPIGYSHADVASLRPNLQNYLACGDDPTAAIDFFGLNVYEWCGDNTYKGSGYRNLTNQIKGKNIPFFFSEDGCIHPEPRTFQDQNAVFGPKMTPYWSGAIIYEWIMEENHYGLITYDKNPEEANALTSIPGTSFKRQGTPTPVTPDFSNLMAVWATNTPSSTPKADYKPTGTTPACPSFTSDLWYVNGDVLLPTLGEKYNSDVQFSISAGHLPGKPRPTVGASSSKSVAPGLVFSYSAQRQILTVYAGLVGAIFAFAVFL